MSDSSPAGKRFSMLKLTGLIVVAVAAFIGLVAAFSSELEPIYRENGLFETASLAIWVLSAVLAFGIAIFKRVGREDRILFAWLSFLAILAALREADAQIWLNPRKLGAYGVRYRVDWWLDGSVPFWLKLGWGLVFVALLLALAVPLLRLWKPGLRAFKSGDRFFALLAVAVGFLAMGFVIDDLLRGTKTLSLGHRQLLEEVSELIGAVLFFAALLYHHRNQWTART